MKKEYKVLVALLSLFLVLFFNNLKKTKIKSVKELTYKTTQKQTLVPTKVLDLPAIEVELLSPEREPFRMGDKNIFGPLSFSKKRVRNKPTSVSSKGKVPNPKKKPVPPQEVVPKVIARYTFLGFMEKGDIKTIFLTKDDETFIVKKGDALSHDYVVQNITDSFIEISSIDGADIMTISLVENTPLTGKQ